MKRRVGLRGFARQVVRQSGILAYLLRSGVTGPALKAYVRTLATFAAHRLEIRQAGLEAHEKSEVLGSFTTDWFSEHAWYWEAVFQRQGWARQPLKVLEIGSWEGRSACWLLKRLPRCSLVAVDTWQGSDENGPEPGLATIEKKFDANLRPFKGRFKKCKGSSAAFFRSAFSRRQSFDLVYVDGSHRAEDVLADALSSFERLKAGGIMILDDYLLRLYPELGRNPAPAIHAFFRLKAGEMELLHLNDQVYLKKSPD